MTSKYAKEFSITEYNGPNTVRLVLPRLALYYSYETIVAFWVPGNPTVVCENVWSKTTGKHLNAIDDDKSTRVDHATFEKLLDAALAPYVETE